MKNQNSKENIGKKKLWKKIINQNKQQQQQNILIYFSPSGGSGAVISYIYNRQLGNVNGKWTNSVLLYCFWYTGARTPTLNPATKYRVSMPLLGFRNRNRTELAPNTIKQRHWPLQNHMFIIVGFFFWVSFFFVSPLPPLLPLPVLVGCCC